MYGISIFKNLRIGLLSLIIVNKELNLIISSCVFSNLKFLQTIYFSEFANLLVFGFVIYTSL